MREILAELWEPVAGERPAATWSTAHHPSLPGPRDRGGDGRARRDADRLHDWSMWIQRQFDPTALADPEQLETINPKVAEFYAWVRPLIERRRASPSDDLISALIAAEEEGDRLSGAELENLVLNILVGGVDTSQSQLAHALRLLSSRPDQWAALRADPDELAPRAVEESLRYEPITPFTARLLTEDLTYGGVTFPADTVVVGLRVHRQPRPRGLRSPPIASTSPPSAIRPGSLTFGAGIHFCVGRNLARAEIAEGARVPRPRARALEPAGEPELQNVSGIYGVESLPVDSR